MSKRSNRGRPAGSTTAQVDTVPVEASRCRACGSTERTKYINRREHEIEGEHNGQPYNLVVWRRCTCTACGQARDDRTYEYAPPAKAAKARRAA